VALAKIFLQPSAKLQEDLQKSLQQQRNPQQRNPTLALTSTATVATTNPIVAGVIGLKMPVQKLVVGVAQILLSATAMMIMTPVVGIRHIVAMNKSTQYVERHVTNAKDDDLC
jgi:hypothetical protein